MASAVRSRKPSWQRIKRHRNYTVDDVSRTLGVAEITVRRWIKDGLPAISDQKPALILGTDLIAYHQSQSRAGRKCQPNECYCVKCREPRVPAGLMVEYLPITPTSGNLRAICPECSTLMHRRICLANLAALRRVLDVSAPDGIEHLRDSPKPCLNETHPKEPDNHA